MFIMIIGLPFYFASRLPIEVIAFKLIASNGFLSSFLFPRWTRQRELLSLWHFSDPSVRETRSKSIPSAVLKTLLGLLATTGSSWTWTTLWRYERLSEGHDQIVWFESFFQSTFRPSVIHRDIDLFFASLSRIFALRKFLRFQICGWPTVHSKACPWTSRPIHVCAGSAGNRNSCTMTHTSLLSYPVQITCFGAGIWSFVN